MIAPRRRIAIVTTVLCLLVVPAAARAQRPVLVGFGGGQSFPTGEFGADTKPGMNIGGFIQYRAADKLVGLRGELSWHRNDMKDAALAELGADPSTTGYWGTLYLGLSGVLESMPRDGAMGWYLLAGGGMYQIRPTITQDGIETSVTETKPGFNAGAGLRFRVGGGSLYLEARYHGLKVDETNFTFLPFTAGIAF